MKNKMLKLSMLAIPLMALGFVGPASQSQAMSFNTGFKAMMMSTSSQEGIYSVAADAENEKDAQNESAKEFIDNMGQKALSFLGNDSLSQSQKENEFRKLLRAHFDMSTIGRFALGKNWRQATPAQQKEYSKLFEEMVVGVYANRFNDYKGERFDVSSARGVGKNDSLVTSHIVPSGGSKIKIDWRVRNKSGRNQIIDVVIEGVSMAQTQRSDFSSVIQRGGGKVEVLLAHLRK